MVPWGYIPPYNPDGTSDETAYEPGNITRQLSREERLAAMGGPSGVAQSASDASLMRPKKGRRKARPRSSPAKPGQGRAGRAAVYAKPASSTQQQLRELMASHGSGGGAGTSSSSSSSSSSSGARARRSPTKKRRPQKKAAAQADSGWGGPELEPEAGSAGLSAQGADTTTGDDTINVTIDGGQSFVGVDGSAVVPPASPGDLESSLTSLSLDMSAVHAAAMAAGKDQGWYHDEDDELPPLDSLDGHTWKSFSGRVRSTKSVATADAGDAPPQQNPERTGSQSVAFSPHLKTWSIARPMSAPPVRAEGLDEHIRSPAARRERQHELTQLGFDASMEVDERTEFFELFRWRKERYLEGESAPAEGGLKVTPRGTVALPSGEGEMTPRRAYLDGCCRSGVLPVPLVRNCGRPRPVSRTGSAARATNKSNDSSLCKLEGGGMMAASGVAHLDLSNRLIGERSWATKQYGDGTHPDTLWKHSNGARLAAPTRSRVSIVASTLAEHQTNLQSVDASNNRFGKLSSKDAFAAKAQRVLNRTADKYGKKSGPGGARPRTATGTRPSRGAAATDTSAYFGRAATTSFGRTGASSASVAGSDSAVGGDDSAELIRALGSQPSLTTVNLSNNRIGMDGAISLADVLAEPTCMIENLVLAGNRLGDAAVAAMAGSLGCSANLRVVNLQDCAIGDPGAVCLADYFSINKKVEVLDLSWNHIRAKGGRAIAGCLLQNDALVDVDLAWNGLGDVEMVENDLGQMEPTQPGATELGGAIAKNSTLTRLDLSNNRIGEQGAFVVADGMDRNKTLVHLVMDGNPVGAAGGRELLRAMRELGDLRDISLKGCNIKQSDKNLFAFDPTQPTGPYSLDLSKKFDRAVASQLIKAVKGSGGRDRWHALTMSMRYRGDDKMRETGCTNKRCRAGCHHCMKPAYWSPAESGFSPLPPADFDDKEPENEKYFDGVDAEGEKYKLPEICQRIEVLLNAGHVTGCTVRDSFGRKVPAVETSCECKGWNPSWGSLGEWLDEEGSPRDTLRVIFQHTHIHRPATEDDVVSGTALLKLKNVIRDARAGSKKQGGKKNEADVHTDAAAEATKKARRLSAAVMKMRRVADMELNPMERIVKQNIAEQRAREAKAEQAKAEKMLQKANALQSSSTTEDEKKQQRAILDMTAKEFYFKAEQVEELLELFSDQQTKAQAIVKLFERTLDTDALLDVVHYKLEKEQQAYVERQLGELYRFDDKNPTGHYRLDLARTFDRLLVMKMLAQSNEENEQRKDHGFIDTSQRLNRYNFRNQYINGKRTMRKYNGEDLPEEGIFEFDYSSTFLDGMPRPFAKARVMPTDRYTKFLQEIKKITLANDTVAHKSTRIRALLKGRYFTCKQICRILYESTIIPANCYCWYCWNNVDLAGKPVPHRPFEIPGGMAGLIRAKKEGTTQVKGLAERVFLPCQHMIACEECGSKVTRKYHKCLFCEKSIEEVVEVDDTRIKKVDFGGPQVVKEFNRLDSDGSGTLDRQEVTAVVLNLLGNKTQQDDIDAALKKMDQDGSGEVEQSEFADWWRNEHSDEHPSGPDVWIVEPRIAELKRRGSLPARDAGDRELLHEMAVLFFGRAVDMLQFKTVVNFFSNEERASLYSRLGPLNALNPLDPDGKWYINLKVEDEREVCQMLVHLAVGEPGENWLGEEFGDTGPTRKPPDWGEVNMRSFDLPMRWLEEIPRRGLLRLVYFTSARQVMVDLRRSLIPKCLISEEIQDLSSLANPFDLLKLKKPAGDKASKKTNFADKLQRKAT